MKPESQPLTGLLAAAIILTCLAGHSLAQQPAVSFGNISARSDPEQKPTTAPTRSALSLDDLIRLGLERHPSLRQAQFDIDAARGKALQAGLLPNPTLSVTGEEMGSSIGPGGLITTMVSQEIVTAGKRHLSAAVAEREITQADLLLLRQRYTLLTAVRKGYFEVLATQTRAETLGQLEQTLQESVKLVEGLVKAKQAAPLDLLQLQLEQNRISADRGAAELERVAAWRKLATTLQAPQLDPAPLAGTLEAPLPDYHFDREKARVVENHPEVRYARVGINRSHLALRRAEVEKCPNVTVGAGYTRDEIDRVNQWTFHVALPLPLFNRNQGNVHAAQAEVGKSVQEVDRVQIDLIHRLATAFGQYAAARSKAERYRATILPQAQKVYDIVLKTFRAGEFDYLRVFQAQRGIQDARLEYVRSLSEAWQAASELAGLLLEEHWPAPCLPPDGAQVPPAAASPG